MIKNKKYLNLINSNKSDKNSDKGSKLIKEISVFKIAATYIGTVVGAGFASGQEVLQFFGYFGINGFLALIMTTFIFGFYGFIILKLGLKYRASSHLQVIKYVGGRWLGLMIDIVITFFLFGALTAMVAGAGAILYEQFGVPSLLGNIIMIAAALGTTLLGIRGVISAISFVVPLLLTGVFSLTIFTVFNKLPISLSQLQLPVTGQPPVPHWFLSAFVYASYNLVIAVAVLAPLGAEVQDEKKLKKGSVWGGLGLGLGAGAILFALLLNMPDAAGFEIPMIFIAGQFATGVQLLYSGILLAEVYTTAIGNLYGFVVRFTDPGTVKYKWGVIITSIIALVASQFGFTNLVRYLYPVVGYAGLFMIGGLTVGYIKESI